MSGSLQATGATKTPVKPCIVTGTAIPTFLTILTSNSGSTFASSPHAFSSQIIDCQLDTVGSPDYTEAGLDYDDKFYMKLDWFDSNSLISAMAATFTNIHCSIVNAMSYDEMVMKLIISLPLKVSKDFYFAVAVKKCGIKPLSVH